MPLACSGGKVSGEGADRGSYFWGERLIGTSVGASTRWPRQHQLLLRALAVCTAVVLAACSSGGSGQTSKKKTAPTSTTAGPTTTTAPPPVMYQVKRGDTLTSIAKFFGISNALLLAANHLDNGDRLTEGQVLTIPPLPPAQVTVDPPIAPSGSPFTFSVTGTKAGEAITFEIDKPDGRKFSGQPHTASPDGGVSAKYQSSGDDPGTYTVVATGDRGTSVSGTYMVTPG